MKISDRKNAEFKLKIKGLLETLPNIRKFSGKHVVIKYGGSILKESTENNIISQVAFLQKYIGVNIVVVHGGGKHVDEEMRKKGLEPSRKIDGKRYTPGKLLPVLDKCFGELNSRIVAGIKKAGCAAEGFHGREKTIIKVKKDTSARLGFVGEVTSVDVKRLRSLPGDCIPVISSLGVDSGGGLYNVNADTVAAAVSAALKAAKLMMLTDVRGIRTGHKDEIFSTLTVDDVEKIIERGIVKEGMIPKLRSGVDVIKNGVKKVHIIKGTDENSIIEEILSAEGVGTQIVMRRR